MTLAALTEAELSAIKEVMSGTPDAARSEPFTWIMALLIICLVIAGCAFARKLIHDLMSFIDKHSLTQQSMQAECHKQARDSLQTTATAAAKCEQALERNSDSLDRNTQVFERVIERLAQP